MIKVDIISGFLGAGKTTIIKNLADILIKRDESIVIIENEFGQIGIDGKILMHNSLQLYEITRGCLCCSLKGTLINTLVEIGQKVVPDRIIIEPSGIFILSEIFEVLRHPEIKEKMVINSIISVIDGFHYLNQKQKYNVFFENQIKYAQKVILTKTNDIEADSIIRLMSDIQLINSSLCIKAYEDLKKNDNELISFIEDNNSNDTKYTPNEELRLEHNSIKLNAFGLRLAGKYSYITLKSMLTQLASNEYGNVLRAKGFVEADDCLYEINYVNGTIDIEESTVQSEPVICIIGENLNKLRIKNHFLGHLKN